MNILGIDFTSSPGRRKPITCLHCELRDRTLVTGKMEHLESLDAFGSLLRRPGPWIAGIDFPFGQSRRFVTNIGWPLDWSSYVDLVGRMTPDQFVQALDDYKRYRPQGDREHRRATDVQAKSISPQKLYGVPVGKMFRAGAPRLRASGATVPLLQDGVADRIVVEAYPGVLASRLLGRKTSYKSDERKKQTRAHAEARRAMLDRLTAGAVRGSHGVSVEANPALADDPTGDHLDALLCAVQAAWAWLQGPPRYGAPRDADVLEGWIAEPSLAQWTTA